MENYMTTKEAAELWGITRRQVQYYCKKNILPEDRLRLPSFDCPNPNCHAKNLVFAASAEARNHAKLVPLKEVPAQASIDFIVCCPKCKQQFAMIRILKTTRIPFDTIPLYGRVAT